MFGSLLRLRLAHTTYATHLARFSLRRGMSGTVKPPPKSDMPWIIGSSVVFVPAFLYVTSEAAFPEHHDVASVTHDDKHDESPHAGSAEEPEVSSQTGSDTGVKVREGVLSTEELTAAIEKSLNARGSEAVDRQ